MNRYIGIILILMALAGCSAPEPVYDPRISQVYEEGYHQLVVDYGDRIRNVRLEGVRIEDAKVYYVREGEYSLTYEYYPQVTLGMEVSYNQEDRGSDNDSREQYMDRRVQEDILIDKDTRIELTSKKFEVNIKGEVGS